MWRVDLPPQQTVEPVSVSVAQAAILTGLSEAEIRKAINQAELPARRRGVRILILWDDLRRWVQQLPAVAD